MVPKEPCQRVNRPPDHTGRHQMNYALEIELAGPSAEIWVPSDHIFAIEAEAKAAGDDLVADKTTGAGDYRIVETTDEPNCRYHAWAGIVTVEDAAELDAAYNR